MVDIPLPILGGYFTYTDRSLTIAAPGLWYRFLTPNPHRWAIMWGISQAGSAWISPFNNQLPQNGFGLAANGDTLIMDFRSLGSLIQGYWYGDVSAVNMTLGCVEVLYLPPQQPQEIT